MGTLPELWVEGDGGQLWQVPAMKGEGGGFVLCWGTCIFPPTFPGSEMGAGPLRAFPVISLNICMLALMPQRGYRKSSLLLPGTLGNLEGWIAPQWQTQRRDVPGIPTLPKGLLRAD